MQLNIEALNYSRTSKNILSIYHYLKQLLFLYFSLLLDRKDILTFTMKQLYYLVIKIHTYL